GVISVCEGGVAEGGRTPLEQRLPRLCFVYCFFRCLGTSILACLSLVRWRGPCVVVLCTLCRRKFRPFAFILHTVSAVCLLLTLTLIECKHPSFRIALVADMELMFCQTK
ncbi:unnamed protein product, partial [Ectocarpus sp. 8 AP-2014]